MLPCLRHDAVICGDSEEGCIDGAHTGYHVADKFFVPRHIYDSDLIREKSKAEIDGHPPLLFLPKAIRIGTGERFYQGGLAVVDMTGSANNGLAHFATPWMAPERSFI